MASGKPAAKGLSFNLLEQLSFYGAYHRHPINQLIHFFFVPTILFSALVWLARFEIDVLRPHIPPGLAHVTPNAALIVALIYSLFYLCLDFYAGASWMVFIGMPLYFWATAFREGVPNADTWAAVLQVISWYMQIHPGHAIFEKRKPALLDSLVQAFALAPLFVWFEFLFLVGYKPQLHTALLQRVEEIAPSKQQEQQKKKA